MERQLLIYANAVLFTLAALLPIGFNFSRVRRGAGSWRYGVREQIG